jgi:amidohydrolase
MLDRAQQVKASVVALRRAIHAWPELGFDVHATADRVAHTLSELGIPVQAAVGKSGVVAYLGEGGSPVVALRADMDALPIQETAAVEFASRVPGRMHACGHDAHTAMLAGVAMLLKDVAIPGEVRLLFQPCEETADKDGIGGAQRMIDDGALIGVDRVLALHVNPALDTGTLAAISGPINAAVDTFRATITGRGGHGAGPDRTVDPVWIGSQVLNALYAIPSRRISPVQPKVLTVGLVKAGSAPNIIPDELYLEGTLRSTDKAVRQQLLKEVETALSLARAWGGDYHLEIESGPPSTINDLAVTEIVRQVAVDLLGPQSLQTVELTMGGEDFSLMAETCPGAMFSLGVRKPGGPTHLLHNPGFQIDEDALPIGAALLAESTLRLLRSLAEKS